MDALPVAFVLLAVSHMNRFGRTVLVPTALLKQLAVLLGPWFIVQRRLNYEVMAAAMVTIAAMLPFLLDNASLTF